MQNKKDEEKKLPRPNSAQFLTFYSQYKRKKRKQEDE